MTIAMGILTCSYYTLPQSQGTRPGSSITCSTSLLSFGMAFAQQVRAFAPLGRRSAIVTLQVKSEVPLGPWDSRLTRTFPGRSS